MGLKFNSADKRSKNQLFVYSIVDYGFVQSVSISLQYTVFEIISNYIQLIICTLFDWCSLSHHYFHNFQYSKSPKFGCIVNPEHYLEEICKACYI